MTRQALSDYQLILGDCLDELPNIPDASVDAIFGDPPYPYIKRDYGYWTEETWMPMMQEVVRQSRRILKPHGSAVFVLQPNSEKVGRMRLWLWRFMVWAGEEWGIVQDAYWWNISAVPLTSSHRTIGLMRSSLKVCLWIGDNSCYRNQDNVLMDESDWTTINKRRKKFWRGKSPSGVTSNQQRSWFTSDERGGVTPFNVLPVPNGNSISSAGAHGHGAGTPLELSDWWLRYITRPGGVVLDPFNGTGTTGVAARRLGLGYIGIERVEKYIEVSHHRLATALDEKPKPAKKPMEDLPMFAEATE